MALSRTREVSQVVETLRWALRQAWGICPGILLVVIVSTCIESVLPAALALTARGLVNAATTSLTGDDVSVEPLLPWLGLGFVLTLVEGLCGLGLRLSTQRLSDELEVEMTSNVLAKSTRLDIAYFEDTASQDELERAKRNPAQRIFSFVSEMLTMGGAALSVTSLVGVLVLIEPLTLVVVAVFALPYLFLQWRLAAARYEVDHSRATKRRWNQYFVSTLTARETLGEVKILRLAPLLIDRFRSLMAEFRTTDRRLYLTNFRNGSIFVLTTTTAVYVLFVRVGYLVSEGRLSIGDLAIFGGAALRLRTALTRFINALTALRTGALHVRDIQTFLEAETETPRRPAARLPENAKAEIVFDDVSFGYPGSSEKALDSISLRIETGETVAVVGENGAGKSTLLKLAARLYDPDAGSIRFDGVDLRDVDRDSLFDEIAFVFQTFSRFEATAAENIAYGDWRALLDRSSRIEDVARSAGVDGMLRSLPRGYETLLGRQFGEADLSGGQWQKIAVARAFAREASLLILDEPTSNLDARAEFELFSRFRELAHGRTAILVSHRFSTVRMADRILVLNGGRIVESGSHDELLAQGGTYAQMYELQRRGGDA